MDAILDVFTQRGAQTYATYLHFNICWISTKQTKLKWNSQTQTTAIADKHILVTLSNITVKERGVETSYL